MGDGHRMTAVEIQKKYKGTNKDLGELLVSLLTRVPPYSVEDQGHGVRVYCGCPEKHMKSVASTPKSVWTAMRDLRSWANKCTRSS